MLVGKVVVVTDETKDIVPMVVAGTTVDVGMTSDLWLLFRHSKL